MTSDTQQLHSSSFLLSLGSLQNTHKTFLDLFLFLFFTLPETEDDLANSVALSRVSSGLLSLIDVEDPLDDGLEVALVD